jgi:branched-chain amino acid aminotransferase
MHYGSSVFEGIRAYETPRGAAIFRLEDHINRLFFSARFYRITIRHDKQEIMQACRDVVKENSLDSAYIRPLVWIGDIGMGLNAPEGSHSEAAVLAQEWGTYLGETALEDGIRACVSSWSRLAPKGYDEGIGLASDGMLSEGAGENLFFVKDGKLYTPSVSASMLAGITRDTVITLAADAGLTVIEQDLPREFMYNADEMFMTGTAAEVTPVVSVDDLAIGDGARGPVTELLQQQFFGLFNGTTPDNRGWLDYV